MFVVVANIVCGEYLSERLILFSYSHDFISFCVKLVIVFKTFFLSLLLHSLPRDNV